MKATGAAPTPAARREMPVVPLLGALYRFCMTFWLGVMVYFTAVLTPTIGHVLPQQFGQVVAALFPGYFRLGEVLAAAAFLLALGQWAAARPGSVDDGRGRIWWRLALAAVALLLVAYNREILLPQAHGAPRGTELFSRLHVLSMALNVATALLALVGAAFGATGDSGRRIHR